MYFPYVFGRKSELLALRAVSHKYCATGQVVPVIEPVVGKPDDLLRCLEHFGKNGGVAIVILNPDQGEFSGVKASAWRKAVNEVLSKHASLMPALKCGPKTPMVTAEAFVKAYSKRKVALLYSSPSLTDAEVGTLVGKVNVAYHIRLQGKMTSAQRKLLPKSRAVDVFDHFNKQLRNADYSGAELFTDRHKTFMSNSVGFGDYTVTGSIFQPGGGKPGAVALHAAYRHPVDQNIWVEHFVSDDVDINTGTAASKYLEAVSKIAAASTSRQKEFGINDALNAYSVDSLGGHFPGLGKSKERQIHHHIALMHDVLQGKL